ncbi:MAG TPA: asparagine synthase (glutamine-hydrolyzing) [Gemmatimonadaceae bacterium]|nr:asparagine synthase (glutamine-hydrolyzing) [Gemmatimonadaceae bacterium]
MCGICGIVLSDPTARVNARVIGRMSDAIAHRGPDDDGQYVNGNVGLGFRRLSIIDLSGGHQPMANEDETVWIAYNGEIFNHAEHRAPLEARGHRFRTRSDTEAIVHLYEEYGSACPRKLRGMFGFAIWDEKRRSLLLARDRSGIKPMFYATTPGGDLVFGSEIKAILASGMIAPEVDDAAVAEYFALGTVSGSRTLIRGVKKLEPGHTLTWKDGRVIIERYWSLPAYEPGRVVVRDLAEAADEFWRRFVEAVDITLMSDVPLGVFLSGGLDSSLIVAAMRERGVSELRTFSVGFAEAEASELPFARIVAKTFETEHHEVACTVDDFFTALPRLTRHRDHPLTFSASIPLFFVSELAASSVKVVLTGEGSDELFAGYGRYPRALLNLRAGGALDAVLPNAARGSLARAIGRLGDDYVGSRLKRSFLARASSFEESYLEPFADFDAAHRALVLNGHGGGAYSELGPLIDRKLLAVNPLEAMLRFDQVTYMEELLAKQDQMSMAASLESRVPFLDHHLIEWAAQLPPDVKLKGGSGKALVRLAAERVLPRTITHTKKRGFLVPLTRWLRDRGHDILGEYMPESDDSLLSSAYVRRLLDEHRGGRDHTARLWRVLAFQVWRRELSAAPADVRAAVA